MKIARESAQKVLDATSGENTSAKEAFEKFATRLKERLEALASLHNCKQLSTQKQRCGVGSTLPEYLKYAVLGLTCIPA